MIQTILALLAILIVPVYASAADGIRPGYWQLVSTVDTPDLPVQITPTSARYCFSAEEVRDLRRLVFRQKSCTITEFSSVANVVTWKMACSGPQPGTVSGEALLKGDSFTSSMKLRSHGNAVNLRVKAKRLGECPQQARASAPKPPGDGE